MSAEYKIHKVISQSKRGGMQVVVIVNGKSVTRHIKGGKGYNPDSNAPTLHHRADQRITESTHDKSYLESEIKRLEKQLDGEKKLTPEQREELNEQLAQARVDLRQTTNNLGNAKEQKARLEREMPLVANFRLG